VLLTARDTAMVQAMLLGGLRRCEVLGLRMEDVHLGDRHPEQTDRWIFLAVAAYTQLRLARGLVDDHRLPWERPGDPAKLTPRARPQRVSAAPSNPGHANQCAEIRQTRTRAPKKHRTTTPNPPTSSQESCLTLRPRFNRKLRSLLLR